MRPGPAGFQGSLHSCGTAAVKQPRLAYHPRSCLRSAPAAAWLLPPTLCLQSDQPVHFLRIDGRAARLVKNDAQFYAQQQARTRGLHGAPAAAGAAPGSRHACVPGASPGPAHTLSSPRLRAALQNEGLVPWAAHPDVLIDRYDVRSLLDIYIEPDPRWVVGACVHAFAFVRVMRVPPCNCWIAGRRAQHACAALPCAGGWAHPPAGLPRLPASHGHACPLHPWRRLRVQGAGAPPAQHQRAGAGGAAALRGIPVRLAKYTRARAHPHMAQRRQGQPT